MRLEFDRRWQIDASPAAGWKLLADVRRLLGCMPGAKVGARPDERHVDGSFVLKVGTAQIAFNGRLEVVCVDEPRRALQLLGDAVDAVGSSKARIELSSCVEPLEDTEACTLAGRMVVSVDGKAGTFGAPALQTAAESLLKQFAKRFAEEARLVQGRMPKTVVPAAPVSAIAPAASPTPAPAAAPTAGAPAELPLAAAEPLRPPLQPDLTPPAPATVWDRFVAWLRRLAGGA
jgi:uncharacterized protein